MRNILTALCLIFAVTLSATAQTAPPVLKGWDRVVTLPPNTTLHVKLRSGSASCRLASASADNITCQHGAKTDSYSRADILSIKQAHRGRSTLVMAGIGAGIGFGIGFGVGTKSGDGFFGPNFLRGAIAGIFAILGAIIGAPIGYFTDFTAGSPIYKAP